MTARIPSALVTAAGILAAGAAVSTTGKARKTFIIGGAIAVGAALVWNAYIEERVIQEVVSAGQFYTAPPVQLEEGQE
jgi:hypothetical protein